MIEIDHSLVGVRKQPSVFSKRFKLEKANLGRIHVGSVVLKWHIFCESVLKETRKIKDFSGNSKVVFSSQVGYYAIQVRCNLFDRSPLCPQFELAV